jgi:hypothetical protein
MAPTPARRIVVGHGGLECAVAIRDAHAEDWLLGVRTAGRHPILILDQVGDPVIVHIHGVEIARRPSGDRTGGIVAGNYIECGVGLGDARGNQSYRAKDGCEDTPSIRHWVLQPSVQLADI